MAFTVSKFFCPKTYSICFTKSIYLIPYKKYLFNRWFFSTDNWSDFTLKKFLITRNILFKTAVANKKGIFITNSSFWMSLCFNNIKPGQNKTVS
jgi:hypothetical protein